jgi:hypothetical protein
MKKIACFVILLGCVLICYSQDEKVVTIKEEESFESQCDYLSLCGKHDDNKSTSSCYKNVVQGSKCEIDVEKFEVLIAELKKRQTDTGNVSIDLDILLKKFIRSNLKVIIRRGSGGAKLFTIKNMNSGKTIYSATLVLIDEKTYTRVVSEKANFSGLKKFNGNTVMTNKNLSAIAKGIFDKLIITVKVK